jgi:hypothetical protein
VALCPRPLFMNYESMPALPEEWLTDGCVHGLALIALWMRCNPLPICGPWALQKRKAAGPTGINFSASQIEHELYITVLRYPWSRLLPCTPFAHEPWTQRMEFLQWIKCGQGIFKLSSHLAGVVMCVRVGNGLLGWSVGCNLFPGWIQFCHFVSTKGVINWSWLTWKVFPTVHIWSN